MKIPSSSIPRISIYYRTLLSLPEQGIVSSEEISSLTGCNAAQIRKDLAYFGQFGKRGQGYSVNTLTRELKKILGIGKNWNVALVGAGNLGSALLAYKGFYKQGFNIKKVFDNDKNKIGKSQQGAKVIDIKNLKRVLKSDKIDMVIVAVPHDAAQGIINDVISVGVRAVLNFAPIVPKTPKWVEVLNIDLSIELEQLAYFLQKDKL